MHFNIAYVIEIVVIISARNLLEGVFSLVLIISREFTFSKLISPVSHSIGVIFKTRLVVVAAAVAN